MDPFKQRKDRLMSIKEWPAFFAALSGFLAWKKLLRVVALPGNLWLCSYYAGLDDWDMWTSSYDPRR